MSDCQNLDRDAVTSVRGFCKVQSNLRALHLVVRCPYPRANLTWPPASWLGRVSPVVSCAVPVAELELGGRSRVGDVYILYCNLMLRVRCTVYLLLYSTVLKCLLY